MEAVKVGMREFRDKLATYLLEAESPVAITRLRTWKLPGIDGHAWKNFQEICHITSLNSEVLNLLSRDCIAEFARICIQISRGGDHRHSLLRARLYLDVAD